VPCGVVNSLNENMLIASENAYPRPLGGSGNGIPDTELAHKPFSGFFGSCFPVYHDSST
jgi:hypothetical protein